MILSRPVTRGGGGPWAVGLAGLAVVWALAIPSTAALGEKPDRLWTRAVVAGMDRLGAVICHQKDERSFHTAGVRWPVCARCSGLYAGAAIGAILALLAWPGRRWDHFVRRARQLLVMASAPTLATIVIEWASHAMPPNPVRAGLAVPLGAVIGWILTRAAGWPARDALH